MKILTTWVGKNIGMVAIVELDCDPPSVGKDEAVRASDGARWVVTGIEFTLHRPPEKGDRVGLLLRGAATFQEGDQIEIVQSQASA